MAAILALNMLGCSVYANDSAWESNSVNVDLSSVEGDYDISQGGVYNLTGSLSGMVYVNTDDTVKLVLNGVNIESTEGPAIFFENSEKGIVELAENSENTLTDSSNYSVDAKSCIFSNDDLVIQGSGSLNVKANYNHGIASDDGIEVNSGNITVDSIGDSFHANNDITFLSGNINITSKEDGIQAEENVNISDGVFIINATGEVTETTDEMPMGGGRGGFGGNRPEMTEGTSGEMPQFNGERPEMPEGVTGNMPNREMPTPPDNNGDMSTPPELPQGEMPDNMRGGRGFDRNGEMSEPNSNVAERPTEAITVDEASTETTTDVSSKGIKADKSINISNGEITVNSNDHCIKAEENVVIDNGTITLNSTVGKGIKAVGDLTVNNGIINIDSKDEGMESKAIMTINSGTINIKSDDDGLNAGGGSGEVMIRDEAEAEGHKIILNGGEIYINSKCDSLDSNGIIEFNGSIVDIDGPTSGGDGSIDFGYSATVNDGTIFAVSSAGMVECPDGTENRNVLNITLDSQAAAGSKITIKNSQGQTVAEKTAAKEFQNIIYSSDSIVIGEEYTIYINDTETLSITPTSENTEYGNSDRGMGRGQRQGFNPRGNFTENSENVGN